MSELDYKDENVWLMFWDCLERMKEIPDRSVNMILTDIPYNSVNRQSNGLRNLNKDKADILTFSKCQELYFIWRKIPYKRTNEGFVVRIK